MSKEFRLKILAEMVVFVALSAALYYIRIYTLPMGGSVTAGSMIPILWLSLRRGVRAGVEAGFILGLIVMTIEPFLFYPVQVMLDYLIPFAAIGLAGFFKTRPLVGVGVGMGARFISHFLSGIIFAELFIPAGENPIIYSALYNGTYIVPEFVISVIVIYLLAKRKVLEIYL
jgi:thiamine transporter